MALTWDRVRHIFRNLIWLKYHIRLFGYPAWVKQPTVIHLDTHNYCNAKCSYCNPQHLWCKERGFLPLDVIEAVLKYFHHKKLLLSQCRPFINGEPMLEHRLPEILGMVKKYTSAETVIYSNAITYENRELLLDKNLNRVKFTVSAATRETYRVVHGVDKFADAIKTVLWFKRNKRRDQKLHLNYVYSGLNAHELPLWRELFTGIHQIVLPLHEAESQTQSAQVKGDIPFASALNVSGGSLQYSDFRPCACWHVLSISWRGEIMQCCDIPYKYNWGHVDDEDILDVWNQRNELGLDHEGCSGCNLKNPMWNNIFEKYVWS